ncbi:MAG: antitoxin Xre/MbcA/ParS toxin-binding domain-containing protein [Solirubrobacteraceae bacterium]
MEPAYIPIWLSKPLARLDDRRPVDVIRSGEYRRVSRLVAALEGTPVA